MEIPLKKPIHKDDAKIEKLTLNLEGLKGSDIIDAEQEARMRGDISPNPLYSSSGLAIIAARASGHIPDDIINLSAPDFIRVTSEVNNFLYGWVLPNVVPSEG